MILEGTSLCKIFFPKCCYKKQKISLNKKEKKYVNRKCIPVKVEVHSSSSGAGSDENLSSPELSVNGSSQQTENEYEDIYVNKEKTIASDPKVYRVSVRKDSRDSGSHSRSESISSINSNNIISHTNSYGVSHLPQDDLTISVESGVSSASPSELINSEEEQECIKKPIHHTLPHQHPNSRLLKRVVSEPVGSYIPPPPPPPLPDLTLPIYDTCKIDDNQNENKVTIICPSVNGPSQASSVDCIDSTTTMEASERATTILVTANELSASSSSLKDNTTSCSIKQHVIPFIPPKFSNAHNESNCLIKPSEYLRSIAGSGPKLTKTKSESNLQTRQINPNVKVEGDNSHDNIGPPPPPLPDSPATLKSKQPLSFISAQDLTSVQLRKTNKTVASKTMSAPYASNVPAELQCQKKDLIEELKMSKDITGIKKLKVERIKMEEKCEREMVTEITKQFSTDSFVQKVPDVDNAGNPIPPWKRQMLAKKAAEKAKKELEEKLTKEAEERKLQAIPAWKRQLMKTKKVEGPVTQPVSEKTTIEKEVKECGKEEQVQTEESNKENNKPVIEIGTYEESNKKKEEEKEEEEDTYIMPWRAQLRKTNSKLNLLE